MKRIIVGIIGLMMLVICIRGFWYYPLFRKPPILEMISDVPCNIPYIKLKNQKGILKRYFVVIGDKKASFPDAGQKGWSEWASSHEIYIDSVKNWIKVFIDEKWLIFRKKTAYLFYQQPGGFNQYTVLFRHRYQGDNEKLKNKYNIYFIGDSITRGLYAINESNSYSALVNAKAGMKGTPVKYAIKGIGISDIDKTQILSDLTKNQPELIIIELGTNDWKEMDIEKFKRKYESMLSAIVENAKGTKTVLLGLWGGYKALPYDAVIYDIAKHYQYEYVYLEDIYEESEYHNEENTATSFGPADFYHPSDKGHREIANRVISAIVSLENKPSQVQR
ncbi:MAG: SGNH/GDSL hydrolase family protein [candidate division FCPU426 bacterium]